LSVASNRHVDCGTWTEEDAKRLSGADGQGRQILQGLVGHWVTEIPMHAAWSLPVAANEANPDAR